VAGRLALVIGSECAALNPLNFAAELAGDLQAALGAGGWQPVGGVPAPVLDPGIGELRATLTQAFRIAHEQQATLLVAFIGHGATTGAQDFHLLAHDSPAAPDAESAFHLGQGIRDRLNKWAGLDGLIVLVDACQTGEGVQGAARRWTDVLAVGGRMELLVAAGDDNAFGGCFTRTLLATFGHNSFISYIASLQKVYLHQPPIAFVAHVHQLAPGPEACVQAAGSAALVLRRWRGWR
jgi:hypothetical protein